MWRGFADRLLNMLARAVVKAAKDDKKLRLLQLAVLDEETLDDVEHFEPYGFTSVPDDGAEALVGSVGGHRDHSIAFMVADRRYRPTGNEKGEVMLYDKNGTTVLLKANGDLVITPSSGTVVVDGSIEISGDVDCDGTITAATDVKQGSGLTAISLKDHTHPYTDADTASGGSGGDKDTGAPN